MAVKTLRCWLWMVGLAPCAVMAGDTDLTIEIGGDLLRHGGVVIVYPLPVDAETWEAVGGAEPRTVSVESRGAVLQLRYPEGESYVYRFKEVGDDNSEARVPTQVLWVTGTDEKGRGPVMREGFTDAVSSGGRTIRVLPRDEYAGEGEATRTMARWGEIEGWATPPPADERSARVLAGILDDTQRTIPMTCPGTGLYQVCSPEPWTLPEIERRWWRGIAQSRLERLRHKALRACYDSTWLGGGKCDPDPRSDEPKYIHSR